MNKETLIERYFSHRLSDEGFQELKQLLETDIDFRQEFYSQLEVRQVIAHENHRPLKERLQNLDRKQKKKKPWVLYAAAVSILIAIGLLFYDTQTDYQKLYATHFEPYPNVISLTTRSDSIREENTEIAFELYRNRQFKEAAAEFQEVYSSNPKEYVHFYYGVSLLANGDIEEGIRVLESLSRNEEHSDFTTVANWYLGLGYIKLEQPEQARYYLQKVVEVENTLSSRAKEVLAKLN